MVGKIVFAALLVVQFAAITSVATAVVPLPGCLPCGQSK